MRKYRELHKEYFKEYNKKQHKKYYQIHNEQLKKYKKEYRKTHKKQTKNYFKKYIKTEKGKLNRAKILAKSRNLGFNLIAKLDNQTVRKKCYHHINNIDTIEIPLWLHRKYRKNHRNKLKKWVDFYYGTL